MKKLLVIFGIVLLLSGCSSGHATTNAISTQKLSVPIVLSMSGSLDQSEISEPFTITKQPFTVNWEFHSVNAAIKGAWFDVTAVNDGSGNTHVVAHIINMAKSGSIQIFDTGTFHLSINSYAGSWGVQVEGE
jgi:hypothetical protein